MCAIVGIFGNSDAAKLATAALFEMQHRGHEATGISCGGQNGDKNRVGGVLQYLEGQQGGAQKYSFSGRFINFHKIQQQY